MAKVENSSPNVEEQTLVGKDHKTNIGVENKALPPPPPPPPYGGYQNDGYQKGQPQPGQQKGSTKGKSKGNAKEKEKARAPISRQNHLGTVLVRSAEE